MEYERPRVKRPHNPERLEGNRIRVGTIQYPVGAEVEDDEQGTIWHLLTLMDGSRTVPQLVREMSERFPNVDPSSVHEAIRSFLEAGYLEDAAVPAPASLTTGALERYDRNLSFFSWVDTQPRASPYEHQVRLGQAKVMVIGIGGSGSAAATSLVAAGVGSVHLVDFDRVEVSNLNRQTLFTEADVGRPKVEVAVERLSQLNSLVKVTGQDLQVKAVADLVPLFEGSSIVVLSADKPAMLIQEWANEAALRTRTPWVTAGYAGPMVVVGTFIPFETPCVTCLRVEHRAAVEAKEGAVSDYLFGNSAVNAVIAPSANVSGQIAALEAIYHITGLPAETRGKILHLNIRVYSNVYYVTLPRWDACPSCGTGRSGAQSLRPGDPAHGG